MGYAPQEPSMRSRKKGYVADPRYGEDEIPVELTKWDKVKMMVCIVFRVFFTKESK